MSNEVLWFLLYLASFTAMLVGYKYLGKPILFGWIAMAMVIANIQVTVTVGLFGMVSTLGNIVYGSTFLATDILSEKYGKKEARRAVWLGFFTTVSVIALMKISMSFIAHESDFMMPHIQALFDFYPRIVGASLAAYLFSQLYDTWAYQAIRKVFPKHLWLRNNGSTLISQLMDTAIFTGLAFYGVFPLEIVLAIGFSTYVLKAVVSILDTPFLYLATLIRKDENYYDEKCR